MNYKPHTSVLLQEVLQWLVPDVMQSLIQVEEWRRAGLHPVIIDCTLGRAGHTFALLERFPDVHVIAFDQDQDAIDHAKEAMIQAPAHWNLASRLHLIHTNFADPKGWEQCLKLLGGNPLIAVLADLGVSSHHFDSDDRGFSFRRDGPLDMRMDQRQEVTAASLLANSSEEELAHLLRELGEEPFAERIAREIVEKRRQEPLVRTSQLEEICFLAYPKAMRHRSRHPATLAFQALRMAVNNELGVLKDLLERWHGIVGPNSNGSTSSKYAGCRLGIISFHSLEDRLVKHTFKQWHQQHDQWQILTKRPLIPTDAEVASNPRSRSAKLRVIQC